MIQRIQSIYFILSATLFGLLFTPQLSFFKDVNHSDGQIAIFQDGKYNTGDSIYLLGGTILIITSIITTLFLYKNRGLQKTITMVSILFSIAFIGGIILVLLQSGSTLEINEVRFGFFIPVFAIILLLLGRHAIIKDNKLVKSMDRLR